jgi:hypothetical protein
MVNFSGVWILNLEKSKLQSTPPDSSTFYISHNEQSFSLDRTHIINGLPDHFAIELKTDGTATEMNLRGIDIIAKIYWDKEALVSDMSFRQGNQDATNIVKYSIEDKGQTLIAEEYFSSSEHKHYNRWVFDRNEAVALD